MDIAISFWMQNTKAPRSSIHREVLENKPISGSTIYSLCGFKFIRTDVPNKKGPNGIFHAAF